MTVAAGEQRARHEHRQIEFCAGYQLLVVEVAAHRARDQRGDAAPRWRRRHAHHAEERLKRQVKPPWQPAHHPLLIERNVDQPGLVEIVGQGAGEWTDQVIAPVLPEPDVENLDFKHVARFGAFDGDWTGQDMTRQHPLVLRVNLGEFGWDMKFAPVRHHLRPAADGVDRHFIAAGDGEDRFQLGFEEAPVAGLRGGMQMMV